MEINTVQHNWCILSVPHLIVYEGDAPTARPVLWDLSLLNMPGSLRPTILQTQLKVYRDQADGCVAKVNLMEVKMATTVKAWEENIAL